jgi:hypothetical protein
MPPDGLRNQAACCIVPLRKINFNPCGGLLHTILLSVTSIHFTPT